MSEDLLESEASLSTLRDVFLLVDQACKRTTELSSEEKTHLSKINDKINFYHTHLKRLHDDQPSRKRKNNFSFQNVIPRFTKILRDFIYTHQWPQALKWVHALTKEVVYTDSTIWKAGLECLIQNGSQHSIQTYVRKLHTLKSLTCVEVLLDYLLHLLTLGELLEAKELIVDLKTSDKLSQNVLSNERRKEAHLLFHAYQGLVLYLEWKTVITNELSDDDMDNDMMTPSKSGEHDRKSPETIADKAVEYLMTVKDTPGVWDIFLFKVVEIHEHYEKLDEARAVLKSYRERNPKNPNAHQNLYNFEKRHEGDQNMQLQCLKNLIELDPSNPMAITLFETLEETSPAAVTVLFNFLDYDHCKDDVFTWKLLSKYLTRINEQNITSAKKTIVQCWDVRKDWWPSYILQCDEHQSCQSASKMSSDSSLIHYKRMARDALYEIVNTESPKRKKRKL